RATHAVLKLSGSYRWREDVDGHSKQIGGTLGDPARNVENFICWRSRRNPRALQVTVVLDASDVNLNHTIQREIFYILSRIRAPIVGGQPCVRYVDKESTTGLF